MTCSCGLYESYLHVGHCVEGLKAEVERLLAHQKINEQKIEEQTREIERLRVALENTIRDRDDAVAENERLLAEAEREIANVYRMWHACGLKKAERGIPAGTLCDDCLEAIAAHVKVLKGGQDGD